MTDIDAQVLFAIRSLVAFDHDGGPAFRAKLGMSESL